MQGDYCSWLPLGIDENIFSPISQDPQYDILFTGYLRQPDYQNRLLYLKKLLASDLIEKYKVALAVSFGSRFIPGYVRKSGAIFLGRLPMDQYAKAVANSKICVNILQSDGKQPLNPLFFGIGACASCQVIEYRDYFDQWLQSEQHFASVTPDNFIATLDELLAGQGYKSFADRAYQAVIPHHTFNSRAQAILEGLTQISPQKGIFKPLNSL